MFDSLKKKKSVLELDLIELRPKGNVKTCKIEISKFNSDIEQKNKLLQGGFQFYSCDKGDRHSNTQ